MSRKLALLLSLAVWSTGILLPKQAFAQVPLTRAVVQSIRNRVQLMPQKRPARPARVSDSMVPGDGLATSRSSLAELRFNDGSLARVGEQAVFRFAPKTRTFQLSNGTVLLLIPPGRGRTGVRTPNAAAGIQGSALFVRYIPDTDTTLVGALTNNPKGPMVVYNRDESQSRGLRAGQLAVIVQNKIEQVYEFDLNTFYETSDLVKGLNLTQEQSPPGSDSAIAAVRAETVEALRGQSPLVGSGVIENPAFIRLSAARSGGVNNTPGSPDPINGSTAGFGMPSSAVSDPINRLGSFNEPTQLRQFLEGGEVLSNQGSQTPGSGVATGGAGSGGSSGNGMPGGGGNGSGFPGRGATEGEYPGQGATGGEFPGGGSPGGQPGGGPPGGEVPGGGDPNGTPPGGGIPGSGPPAGNPPGGQPGGEAVGGQPPGNGQPGNGAPPTGETPGQPPTGGSEFPGGGATEGQFPGGGATEGQFPGGGAAGGQPPGNGNGQPGNGTPPTGETPGQPPTGGSEFPGGGATEGQFPGGGATEGQFPGGGAAGGQSPGNGNGQPGGRPQ